MKKPNDPPEGEPLPRRAARVLLLDADGRVLLRRYAVEDYVFWCTPGGAVEPGESDQAAAARELHEELRLQAELHGPVHSTTGRFHHEGRYVENTDVFFVARIAARDLRLYGITAFESAAMKEARWWPIDALDTEKENIFPRDLPSVLRRLHENPPTNDR